MFPSVITTDPGIICFQHCVSKVFCFNFPSICPTCNCQLIEKDLKLLPFRLPYPFVKASQYPCAVVLRPTTGDFLNDYNNSMDLHIAVTTSRGVVVEFDQNGLQRTTMDRNGATRSNLNINGISSAWSQSLLVESVTEPWYDLWDSVLMQICKQPNWTVDHYNEDQYNCYTFVLTFLQALCYDKLSQAAQSKTVFCEKYIVPRTTTAGKYISLFRKIRDHDIYTHLIKITDNNDDDDDEGKEKNAVGISSGLIAISQNNNGKPIGAVSGNTDELNANGNGNGGSLIRKLCTIEE